LGLEYAGFDVMTTDLQSERFTVIEVNSRPDIDLHHYPDAGEPVNVAREIVGAVVAKVKNNWSAFEGN
jgi:D-alanine-D-alanine ligase-like ATP-grasp enzyme